MTSGGGGRERGAADSPGGAEAVVECADCLCVVGESVVVLDCAHAMCCPCASRAFDCACAAIDAPSCCFMGSGGGGGGGGHSSSRSSSSRRHGGGGHSKRSSETAAVALSHTTRSASACLLTRSTTPSLLSTSTSTSASSSSTAASPASSGSTWSSSAGGGGGGGSGTGGGGGSGSGSGTSGYLEQTAGMTVGAVPEGAVGIVCPVCGARTIIVRDSGIDALQRTVKSNSRSATAEPIVCSGCEVHPATVKCKCTSACPVTSCEECKPLVTRMHSLHGCKPVWVPVPPTSAKDSGTSAVGRPGFLVSSPSEECPEHGDPLKMFCIESGCQVPVCCSCLLIGKHRHPQTRVPHECIPLKEALEKSKSELSAMASSLSLCGTQVRDIQQCLSCEEELLNSSTTTALEEIQRTVEFLKAEITKKGEALAEEVTLRHDEIARNLRKQRELLSAHSECISAERKRVELLCGESVPLLWSLTRSQAAKKYAHAVSLGNALSPTACMGGVLVFSSSGLAQLQPMVDGIGNIVHITADLFDIYLERTIALRNSVHLDKPIECQANTPIQFVVRTIRSALAALPYAVTLKVKTIQTQPESIQGEPPTTTVEHSEEEPCGWVVTFTPPRQLVYELHFFYGTVLLNPVKKILVSATLNPNPPNKLEADKILYNSMTLQWEAERDVNREGFFIEISEATGTDWKEVYRGAGTSCVVGGLTAVTSYNIRIFSYGAHGISMPCQISAQTTPLPQVHMKLWGAGGASGNNKNISGGSGGFTEAIFNIPQTVTLNIIIGQGGDGGYKGGTATTFGGGGAGGINWDCNGNSGGGGTFVFIGEALETGVVLAAAGGGGSCGSSYGERVAGGSGGGALGKPALTSYHQPNRSLGFPGLGGTQSGGGAGGKKGGEPGRKFCGGVGCGSCDNVGSGGGGGGWYGGGGGGGRCGAGGGGSGYVNSGHTWFVSGDTLAGPDAGPAAKHPPRSEDPDYSPGVGVALQGGMGALEKGCSSGGNGMAVICVGDQKTVFTFTTPSVQHLTIL
ncbi:hypothetical protein Pelo_665 [Pelomyxa schiedti]|nr:hypothetical protein Pelo_665 [Pelomyxa schiedti]